MKKEYILLLIIPICFAFLSFSLRSIEGPYYNGFSDPNYAYLMNSLSLAQISGYDIGHVDHPGTPLQVAGAVVIKVFYTFSHERNDLAEDVLYRPETYLNAINYTLIFLNSLGLYIMGLIIYRVKKNIFISLFFQTIPFVSINIAEVFPQVKTESFVFFIAVIFISLMFKLVYDPPEKINYFVIGIGVLSGLILATKISFLCLLILPLVLIPGLSKKLIFISTAFLSFIIFVLPAISNAGYFVTWVTKLIFNSGRYGKGDPTILDSGSFFNNITKIFINEKFFALVYFVILFVLILSVFLRKNTEKNNHFISSPEIKFLFAVFLAMSLQIVMVAKHYSHRYMYPALILAIPGLYIAISILYKKYFPRFNANIVFGSILVLTLFFSAYISRKLIARTKTKTIETVKLYNFIHDKYPDANIILSSGVSNEAVGPILGYFYSGQNVKQKYLTIINNRFPDRVWYDIFRDQIYSLTGTVDIKNILTPGHPVLLQTTEDDIINKFIENLKVNFDMENIGFIKIFSNENGEQIFELTK